ncbi:NifU family protein [Actinomadura algeriensis]|uniref:Fe-S cluster biogenesis protein NfuA n=1 Tax=Actinomadura algeriensis TaxID=1679523 RepID=A0ABR9JPA0_9ACTN|nr:NifU family protein [Actinomadura algeriensis]MBE1532186.1 Fe-S cluster biogenesis protein NfuA [Actinomadura algeriensis]
MADGRREDRRLGEGDVAERLTRIEEALAALERTPGRTAESALDTVATLAEVYGEALARVMDRAAHDARLVSALTDDDLVGHLLALHDVHPAPVEERVARALADIREQLGSHGADVELDGIEDGVARVRLPDDTGGGGCGSCGTANAGTGVEDAVRDAVLGVAPELSAMEPVRAPSGRPAGAAGPGAFVPVESLLRGLS